MGCIVCRQGSSSVLKSNYTSPSGDADQISQLRLSAENNAEEAQEAKRAPSIQRQRFRRLLPATDRCNLPFRGGLWQNEPPDRPPLSPKFVTDTTHANARWLWQDEQNRLGQWQIEPPDRPPLPSYPVQTRSTGTTALGPEAEPVSKPSLEMAVIEVTADVSRDVSLAVLFDQLEFWRYRYRYQSRSSVLHN